MYCANESEAPMPTDAELMALVEKWRLEASLAEAEQWYAQAGTWRGCATALESLLRPQEPEQAARERLGRWLTEKEYRTAGSVIDNRAFAEADGDRFEFSVFEDCRMRTWVKRTGHGEEPADAINAALDAAERGGT